MVGLEFVVKKKRLLVEEIVAVLKQVELGMTVADATLNEGFGHAEHRDEDYGQLSA